MRLPVSDGLTAAIIARDEEHHLGACLDSLAWAGDRLVVLDDRTTDRSTDVARSRGVRVVHHRFRNFPTVRNEALSLVSTRWVFFVDADERSTSSLAAEIRSVIANQTVDAPVGYWVPRRNFIWGGWIQHGGWYPDYQLRLLRVDRARYDERRDVHEVVQLDGVSGYLAETLIHYNYDSVTRFLDKQRLYSTLDAERLAREGHRVRPHAFLLQPCREFLRRYVELEGRHDGWRGLALAALLAWYTAVTHAKLARRNGLDLGYSSIWSSRSH